MNWVVISCIVILSAFLWRIRGGLWEEYIPENKIWYALFFGIFGYFYFGNSLEKAVVGFIACYASYQLYGWACMSAGCWMVASLTLTLCNTENVS